MNFDPVARWFRWIEYAAFGRALERRRFAFLHRLVAARRILILGEGDGRCLERLLVAAPSANFDVVDSSARMIAITRKRTGDSARVRFYLEDAVQLSDFPSVRYDGVVTLFFLDCLTEAQAVDVIHRITAVLEPGGIWLVSEFAIPPDGWRRWHAKIWVELMYRFFRTTTNLTAKSLPAIDDILSEAGMCRVEREEERFGLISSTVWSKPCPPPDLQN